MLVFNDTATTEIYTLSLHDALPISLENVRVGQHVVTRESFWGRLLFAPGERREAAAARAEAEALLDQVGLAHRREDRKSTRLNSSHANISYAVFCLNKKTRLLIEKY